MRVVLTHPTDALYSWRIEVDGREVLAFGGRYAQQHAEASCASLARVDQPNGGAPEDSTEPRRGDSR
jgi:hypothetical protein